MDTPEEISQWVINNRYAKSEKEKVSDFEMYHTLIDAIKKMIVDNKNSVRLETSWKVLEKVGFTRGDEFTDDDILDMIGKS
jgi:hypothetical protein